MTNGNINYSDPEYFDTHNIKTIKLLGARRSCGQFKTLKKEELTKYKVLQLEAETKQDITAYITQEETANELVRRMVVSIETE